MDALKQSIADQSGFWGDFDGSGGAFGEPLGPAGGAVFRPGAPRGRQGGEKNRQNVVSEVLWMHVRVLLGTRSGPKGVFVMKT